MTVFVNFFLKYVIKNLNLHFYNYSKFASVNLFPNHLLF